MTHALVRSLVLVCAVALFGVRSVLAQAPPGMPTKVDLELIIAVDISLSMDLDELRVQRQGYVAALRDAEVQRVMISGPSRRIAITYFEWAGPRVQKVIAPWTIVDSASAANALADVLDQAAISRERMTSISGALVFSGQLFNASPYGSPRRVIDMSGDGPNNAGLSVVPVRDDLVARGVVINGLPLTLKTGGSVFDIPNLDEYYADCVIGGPGSFVIPVKSEAEFAPTIRRKLLLEIAGLEPPARLVKTQAQLVPRVDCMIGEQLWRRYMDGRFPN